MNTNIKKEFILEGLDCAHCAMKIEERLANIDNITVSSVNFASQTLTIEVTEKSNLNKVISEAKAIIAKMEPDVVVRGLDSKEEKVEKQNIISKVGLVRLILGFSLFIVGIIGDFSQILEFGLFFTSYILVGSSVIIKAIKNIVRGQVFDENFLMSLATVGAFVIGQFAEGVAVMLFYQVGELVQDSAVNHSRRSITALLDIRPDFANLKIGETVTKISPERIKVGDIIAVKPGEKVPLDGIVISGNSTLDTSAITGESMPRSIKEREEILSGTINLNGYLLVEVTKEYSESTVAKILDLVQNAGNKKAPTEKFITKFAGYYTPIVVFTALGLAIIPPLFIEGATFLVWIYRSLIFLVVSCPCALVISIPLGFFGGIGGASKAGILMKGSNYLEALNSVDTVVFDKTGTLTKGEFSVVKVVTFNRDIGEDELLQYAAIAESHSNHPISKSIRKAYNKAILPSDISNFEEIIGHGVSAAYKDIRILAGNSRLMEKEGINIDPAFYNDVIGTVVHVAVNQDYAGYILIADSIKEDALQAMKELKKLGVRKLVMFTGDNKQTGEYIGSILGIDEVYSELLPHQKVEMLEMLEARESRKGKLIFVGDGINDAPVLMRADVGIAMGGVGSDAAIEAADVVIMTDEPSKIAGAIRISRRTKTIIWQNIIFAFTVKGVVLLLGAGGLATMWEAVFADVGVAVIAVFNAMRVLHGKNE